MSEELKRPPPRLVAVSKFQSEESILEAYNAGQRHFGENYVQELITKASKLPKDIEWHFIGSLQTNKAKPLLRGVPNLSAVESVHSSRCADALQTACIAAGRTAPLHVFLQVCTSAEESKSGCEPGEATAIARHIAAQCPALRLSGLMTIGRLDDPDPAPYFKSLRLVRAEVAQALSVPEAELELSMGMSADFPVAIREGSTNVRVGSTIFGARRPAGPVPGPVSGDGPHAAAPAAI